TMPCTYVVGVAQNIARESLSEDAGLHYYVAIDQFRPRGGGLFLRTAATGPSSVEAVRRSLQGVMPGAAYVNVKPMEEVLSSQTRSWRLGATMFAVFGLLALALAAVGLYSVIAYDVTQRTHEMGVRVALGARSRDVILLIVREGMRVVVPGVAIGAAAALSSGRWIAPLLFDVSPTDPRVIVLVIAVLIA